MEEQNRRWKAALDEAWPPEVRAREQAFAARARGFAFALALVVATTALYAVATHPRFARKSPTDLSTRGPLPSPRRASSVSLPRIWLWADLLRSGRLVARARIGGAIVLIGAGGAWPPAAAGIPRDLASRLWRLVADAPDRHGRVASRFLLGARAGRASHQTQPGAVPSHLPPSLAEAVPASLPKGQDPLAGTPLGEVLAAVRQEAPYARVTSTFNEHRSGHRRTGGKHGGYDIGLEAGTAVPAAWPGRVVEILPWGGSEHGITVAVGDVRVTYGHLIPRVRLGQLVHTGMPVGLVARDHVDIKIWAGQRYVDFGKENPFLAWPWEGRFYSAAGTIRAGEQAMRWCSERMF